MMLNIQLNCKEVVGLVILKGRVPHKKLQRLISAYSAVSVVLIQVEGGFLLRRLGGNKFPLFMFTRFDEVTFF